MSEESDDTFDQADIGDIGHSMLRFHGEERALELAHHYASISSNERLWQGVVEFLEGRAALRKHVENRG